MNILTENLHVYFDSNCYSKTYFCLFFYLLDSLTSVGYCNIMAEIVDENSIEIIAQYQTTRVRSFWTGYKRIFQLTRNAATTLDPNTFSITNTFKYGTINQISTDDKAIDQFTIDYEKTVYVYKSPYRLQLLCQLYECVSKVLPYKFKSSGPYLSNRIRKNNGRVECKLLIASYGIIELDLSGKIIQEYRWVNLSKIGVDGKSKCFYIIYSGRIKVFSIEELGELINS